MKREFDFTVTVTFMNESRVFVGANYTAAWEKGQVWKQDAMHAYELQLEAVSFANMKAHVEAGSLDTFLHGLTDTQLDTLADNYMANVERAAELGKDEILRRFKLRISKFVANMN